MQGKQYSIEGEKTINGVTYQDAKKAGVIDALNDYNCLHFKTSIILGISEPAYNEEQLKKYEAEDDKQFEIDGKSKNGYAWKQDMRRLETALREQKRIKVAAQADGDKALVKECNAKIKAYQAKYEQISNITGIRQDTTRTTIPREPRKINDVFTTKNSGGIIKEKDTITLSTYVNSSDKLNEYSKNITPIDGFEDVVIHGNAFGFEIRDLDGNVASKYTPSEFADILQKDPHYHGGAIRLISCETGVGEFCAAQRLADKLNVDILAPSDMVFVDMDGNITIGKRGDGKWILFKPKGEKA